VSLLPFPLALLEISDPAHNGRGTRFGVFDLLARKINEAIEKAELTTRTPQSSAAWRPASRGSNNDTRAFICRWGEKAIALVAFVA
jgi:hypothetical protein